MPDCTGTLVPFQYQDVQVRVFTIDGDPWFVLADLCRVLALSNPSMVADRIESDALSTTEVTDSLGRVQSARIVSEPGMYEVIFLSRKPEAREFKRWITGTVLPEIRKTGSYNAVPELTGPELMARALIEADSTIRARDAQIAALTPRAEVADRFLDASGDYSVKDAAGALTRAGVKVGQQRLFSELETRGWIFRGKGDGRWRPYQTALDAGVVSVIPQSHYHPKTGVLVLDAPQIRVTVKGVRRVAADYGVLDLSKVAS